MISTRVSGASAIVLAVAGLLLLFAPEEILPRMIAGLPTAAAWIGQLIAAGCLGMAILNWASRASLLGGIYGRPVVLANALFWFIGATTIFRAARDSGAPELWTALVPVTLFAAVYARLLFGGPIGDDATRFRNGA